MTIGVSVSQLKPEFDEFLYASLGEDENGMNLSVLSVLARCNVDPWQESAALALLPMESAIQRLASLITSGSHPPSADSNGDAQSARLIGLLPRETGAGRQNGGALTGHGWQKEPSFFNLAVCVVFLIFILSTEMISASHQAPAQADKSLEQISVPNAQQISPPASGQ